MNKDSLAFWLSELAPDTEGKPGDSPHIQKPTLLLSVAKQAMACEFEVLLNQHQYPNAPDRALAALEFIEHLESLLSVYRPQSELSKLNHFGAERAVSLTYESSGLLQLAQAAHLWTDGAFDITAGALSEVWGFSRRQGRKPSPSQILQALELVGSENLQLAPDGQSARMIKAGVKVNPGGIGKGYALDRAAQKLQSANIDHFMIHGGLSSVVARGNREHPDTGGGWLVSLKHPWRWEEHMGTIRLRDQALGTSGSGKQFFHFDGKRYSHIIDPRTGWPAESMMSATVICPSGAVADALATAFFVLGPEHAQVFCGKHPNISAILVHQNVQNSQPMITTCNVTEDLWQPAAILRKE